jgi:ppGpp synthetase/RelA/SpoT-type nucleotidyltranferase
MTEDEIKSEFERQQETYRALEREALFVLNRALARSNIKFHSIPTRVKDIKSFLDKVKRKESREPFKDVSDIVGLRVICLFLSDIPRVGQLIRDSFNVVSEDDKIEGVEVDSFGYMSFHFVAEMRGEYKGPRYEDLGGVPFEIQVRTILMDAWANVSHYLDYKTDVDVPKALRRDFYALSGLFYIADSHFELFFKSSKDSSKEMRTLASKSTPELVQQEANLDSFTAYLRTRYPDREHSDPKAISEVLQELSNAGYTSLQQVDNVINRTEKAFEAYEEEYPPVTNDKNKRFADIGAIRISFDIADESFALSRRSGSTEEYAKFRTMLLKQ